MKRSLEELTARSQLALEDDELVEIAATSSSPTAAYDMAIIALSLRVPRLENDGAKDLAKACRWLNMIRRDHGQDALNSVISR